MLKPKDIYCLSCFKNTDITKDHIIPQALGGKLKTPLCDACHQKVHPIDTFTVQCLHPIATLLDIVRERGTNRQFKVKQLETGDDFCVDSQTGQRSKPKVHIVLDKNGCPVVDIRARSPKELNKIIAGIHDKYGDFPKPIEKTKEPVSLGRIEFEASVGGRPFMRTVGKIAYLFLMSKIPKEKAQRSEFNGIREFVFENKGDSCAAFNFIDTAFMIDRYRPLHGIAVHFDGARRNIIGFVQLFGIFRFSVLLSTAIPWKINLPDISYCYDPVRNYEVPLNKLLLLKDMSNEQCIKPNQNTQYVENEIENGLKKLELYCENVSNMNIEFFSQKNDNDLT